MGRLLDEHAIKVTSRLFNKNKQSVTIEIMLMTQMQMMTVPSGCVCIKTMLEKNKVAGFTLTHNPISDTLILFFPACRGQTQTHCDFISSIPGTRGCVFGHSPQVDSADVSLDP